MYTCIVHACMHALDYNYKTHKGLLSQRVGIARHIEKHLKFVVGQPSCHVSCTLYDNIIAFNDNIDMLCHYT